MQLMGNVFVAQDIICLIGCVRLVIYSALNVQVQLLEIVFLLGVPMKLILLNVLKLIVSTCVRLPLVISILIGRITFAGSVLLLVILVLREMHSLALAVKVDIYSTAILALKGVLIRRIKTVAHVFHVIQNARTV